MQNSKLDVTEKKIGENKKDYVSMIRNQIIKVIVIWRI
jgi:hypothetical protein